MGQSFLAGLVAALLAALFWASTKELWVDFTLAIEPEDSSTELFYASPNAPYHHRRSHAWDIEAGGGNNFSWRYRGPLSINSIRIDPIRSAGDIRLGSVRIAGPHGERHLQGPELLEHMQGLNQLEVRHVTPSTLHLVSVGIDPHFSLEVPRDFYWPGPGPFLARLLAVFLLATLLWPLTVSATRPLRTWLSENSRMLPPEPGGNMPVIAALPLLVSGAILALFVLLLSTTAWGYGFWRHDAWGYRTDGLREFHESGRWLAFLLHGVLKQIPHLVAWYAALFSFSLFVFLFLRRFLAGTGAPLILILVLTLAAVIHPGLMSQLNWPVHSLATFFPLAVFALLTRKNSSLFVVFLATILLFPILQSYAFLALLFGLPSYAQVSLLKPGKLFLRFATLLVVWIGAIAIAHLVSRFAQLHYFGSVPAMPNWRNPNPANDARELMLNLLHNTQVYWEHLSLSYSSVALWVLGTAFVLVLMATAASGPGRRAQHLAILGSVALIVSFSVYLFTSPVGTDIPFRSSGTMGIALALMLAALFAGAGGLLPNTALRANLLAAFVLLLTVKPFALAHANMQWFAAQTSNIREALAEVAERPPAEVPLVLIDATHAPLWPEDAVRHLREQPLVFESIDSRMRIAPAFVELGYPAISWCLDTGVTAPAPCQAFNVRELAPCATVNPRLCSGGYSDDGIWYVRF
jgi:hypothetical protein